MCEINPKGTKAEASDCDFTLDMNSVFSVRRENIACVDIW